MPSTLNYMLQTCPAGSRATALGALRSLALGCVVLSAAGCYARGSAGVAVYGEPAVVYGGPSVVVDAGPTVVVETVPVEIESYPQHYYGGSTVFLVDGRWYSRSHDRWVVYRTEPRDLVSVRVGYESRYGRNYRPAQRGRTADRGRRNPGPAHRKATPPSRPHDRRR